MFTCLLSSSPCPKEELPAGSELVSLFPIPQVQCLHKCFMDTVTPTRSTSWVVGGSWELSVSSKSPCTLHHIGAVAPAQWPPPFPVDDIRKAGLAPPAGYQLASASSASQALLCNWLVPRGHCLCSCLDNEVVGYVRKQSLSSQEGPPTYPPSSFTPQALARLEGFSQEGAGLHIWHVWMPQLLLTIGILMNKQEGRQGGQECGKGKCGELVFK